MYLTPIWEKKKLNVTWHPLSPDYAPAANQYLLFPLISYFRAALVISAVLREIFAFWRSSRRFHAVFVVYAVFVVQRLWRSFTFVYMYLRHDIIKLLRNFVLLLLETVGNIYVFEWISFSKVFFFLVLISKLLKSRRMYVHPLTPLMRLTQATLRTV